MNELQLKYKLKFFDFVRNKITFEEVEEFISDTIELEQDLGTDIYIELLTFDYKDKNAINRLKDYLFQKIIHEDEYETWKIAELLMAFISQPMKARELLDKFYHLYCSTYNRQGELTNGYRFLGNLGLNYFYWMDKGYLQITYGDKWQDEYAQSLNNIEFYHSQLKPIAELILNTIEKREIHILKRGKYIISEELKEQLESDNIFELKHP